MDTKLKLTAKQLLQIIKLAKDNDNLDIDLLTRAMGLVAEDNDHVPSKLIKHAETSFRDRVHSVRLQDLPAYLKVFRYEMKLTTGDITVVDGNAWSQYERGVKQPQANTLNRIEKYCNIEIVRVSRVKTINADGFGKRLEEQIKKNGLTKSGLADIVDTSPSNIRNYIVKEQEPNRNSDLMDKFSKVFDVSICYLVTGTNEWL